MCASSLWLKQAFLLLSWFLLSSLIPSSLKVQRSLRQKDDPLPSPRHRRRSHLPVLLVVFFFAEGLEAVDAFFRPFCEVEAEGDDLDLGGGLDTGDGEDVVEEEESEDEIAEEVESCSVGLSGRSIPLLPRLRMECRSRARLLASLFFSYLSAAVTNAKGRGPGAAIPSPLLSGDAEASRYEFMELLTC